MSRANDLPRPQSTSSASIVQPSPSIGARGIPLPPTTPKPSDATPTSTPSNVISVVLPNETTLFGNYPTLSTCRLTGSEYRTIDQRYRSSPSHHLRPLNSEQISAQDESMERCSAIHCQ